MIKKENDASDFKDVTTTKEIPSLFVKGFMMGSADVVPGVSGGTMALILGIFQRLIDAIKSVDTNTLKSLLSLKISDVFKQIHWFFLVVLLSGILSAIMFVTRVIKLPELMFTNPEPVYGLFFGLIVGSVWYVLKGLGKLTVGNVLWIIVGTAIGFRVVTLVPTDTPEAMWFVFLSGSLAITAMILPGISGSFLLLILRKYDYILMQFSKLGGPETMDALWVLVPFGLGLVIGIMMFSRVLSWLLHHYYAITLCVLVGFMIGSLYVIWPFQDREYSESVRSEQVEFNDPIILELQAYPESTRKPEYKKLGPTSNSSEKVEILTVKQKLIHSEPFIPFWSKADSDERLNDGRNSIIYSVVMMLVGIGVIIMIFLLERRKLTSKQTESS
jgi:putative membrane protein